MKSKAVWKGGLAFTGSANETYLVSMDADKSVGGQDLGFRPLQLLAIGLVGCTGMDVISILKKKRQDITEFKVTAEIQRADQHPKVFTKILLTYTVTGKDINPQAVERAVELSETRYCGAQAMLAKTAEISHEIIIKEAD